ncbi:MAG: hypothetical protein K9J12_04915 [Melioribacteraceae bacterium]|nr:hypothetical protein [Melioribacteraceae bacterium]MCF8262915.1 hypothetical protein [Melioribacteraceae bacterium]MCF8411938.1 hypothetical protein [Melioribacteraceae bacterium]MCF8430927.1 hypothetical protein [Melioribacteraceae bacterium]
MRYLNTLILFVFLFTNSHAGSSEVPAPMLDEIRHLYYSSVEEEDYVEVFETFINNNFSNDLLAESPVLAAYNAAIISVKAKHAFWPLTKMNYLDTSMVALETVIQKAPENLEIRFLRFSILHYVPSFLGYSKELESDLEMILRLLNNGKTSGLDEKTVRGVVDFMIESDRLEEIEIANLKREFQFVQK